MEEIWKPVKDYEGLYEVSNMGRVKSLNYRRTGKEKVLKGKLNNSGYLKVTLCKEGKAKDQGLGRETDSQVVGRGRILYHRACEDRRSAGGCR